MPARSLPAHGRAVSEPRSALTLVAGQEPGDRGRGGALSLGYFSLGKQREVTRSPGWRVEKHRDVFSRSTIDQLSQRHHYVAAMRDTI